VLVEKVAGKPLCKRHRAPPGVTSIEVDS
jgi:hypothetical protein